MNLEIGSSVAVRQVFDIETESRWLLRWGVVVELDGDSVLVTFRAGDTQLCTTSQLEYVDGVHYGKVS